MQHRRQRLRGRSRSALGWMLFFFLSGHLLLGLYLQRRHPEFFDPEYTLRLLGLRARLAEAPDRSLALVLGSSRCVFGLRPETVMEQVPNRQPETLLFNFAMLGVGPVSERLLLHHVLGQGIRPQWLFVEVWPPFLLQKGHFDEEANIFSRHLCWSDLPILARLYHQIWETANPLITATLTPLVHYRPAVLEHYAPSLVPTRLRGESKVKEYFATQFDNYGWMALPISAMGSADRQQLPERTGKTLKPVFEDFQVNDVSKQALQELLQECRDKNIRVAFLLMPEHSVVRGWYPSMQSQLTSYLKQLSRQYHALVLDTRDWQADEDLVDCCHLSPRGAQSFSARFGREIYQPLLQGQPLARRLLLAETDSP